MVFATTCLHTLPAILAASTWTFYSMLANRSVGEVSRKVNVDPYFDNTKLILGEAGTKVPYTPQNTWKDPNGDRQDYLEKTKGMTTMQKVRCEESGQPLKLPL